MKAHVAYGLAQINAEIPLQKSAHMGIFSATTTTADAEKEGRRDTLQDDEGFALELAAEGSGSGLPPPSLPKPPSIARRYLPKPVLLLGDSL
jgi:hypothetical protein